MFKKPARPARGDAQAAPAATPMQRRGLVLGVGSAGAAAIAIKLIPGAPVAAAAVPVAAAATEGADGGYRLSAHVRRYYETTRS